MAIEKVGVYRKWLEPVPEKKGKPIPKSQWPKRRRHCWIVRWCGTNRKKYGKLFKTRKEAERHASGLQISVCLGKADRPKKVTLREFRLEHEQVMKGQVAYGTIQEHTRALKFFENYIGSSIVLSKIQPRNAEAFIAYRSASGCRPATVNKDIAILHRIFNLAIEPRGYLAEGQNPFAKIKKRKMARSPLRYVTIQEYRALANETNLWWNTLISIAYGSGLRRNEILHLAWTNVDFENQQIHVSPKRETAETIEWEPKDHEKRVVPMADETAQLLADLYAQAKERFPYIFISPKRLKRIRERQKVGNWTSRSEVINNMAKNFGVIRRGAGVAKCTLHDFRRSAITNWAGELPIQVVQQLAGHSEISTTSKYYLTVRPEDMASANRVLNSIFNQSESRLTQI
jgi:integrase